MLTISGSNKKNTIDEILYEIEDIDDGVLDDVVLDDVVFADHVEEQNIYSKKDKKISRKKNAIKNSCIGITLGMCIGGIAITTLISYSNTFVNMKNAPIFQPIKKQYSNAHKKEDPHIIQKTLNKQNVGTTQIAKKQGNQEKITEKYVLTTEKPQKNTYTQKQRPIPFATNKTTPPYEYENTNTIKHTIENLLAYKESKPKNLDEKPQKITTAKIPPIPKEKPQIEPSALTTLKPGYYYASIGIRDSIYYTAKENGLPDPVIAEIIRLHSFDVDFQREIHNGDLMEVFYYSEKNNKNQNTTPILIYTSLDLKAGKSVFYRFTDPKTGKTGYYDEKGQNASRTFIRTPVDGARISSKFGIRKHPILGYNKMHTGVDFAAPTGTPVRAASHGVIEKIGRYGNYGKYIRVKHKNGQATAYAHLSKYVKGLKKGSKVKQGQIIAYVGSTGRSTGPHLHYEILQNGKPVNPLKVKLAGLGEKLSGNAFNAFQEYKTKIHSFFAQAPKTTKIARK